LYLKLHIYKSLNFLNLRNKTISSGIVDARSYIIETEDSLIGLYVDFVNLQGKWYVYGINLSGSSDFVRALLGLPVIGLEP
jgi:hypothetical protein